MNEIADPLEQEVVFSKTVQLPIPESNDFVTADWIMPSHARGIVLFAHGSGSGRHSTRNKEVASYLNHRSLGTFLLDLLTPNEERFDNLTRQFRFDIPLLAKRLVYATEWIRSQRGCNTIPIGFFGASTGAGAALVAAAQLKGEISAVVSRGGRPDLAGDALPQVTSPTLLIVGGNDEVVEELNREAVQHLHCTKHLSIIPGATHLFEESGTLDHVARLAVEWFLEHFSQGKPHHATHPSFSEMERGALSR
jgi:dienelactone hydrolase